MRTRAKIGFGRDDAGVALTEFCIVIPVILLIFLAALQSWENIQSAELGDYAAYTAARTYSVRINAGQVNNPDNLPDGINPQDAARQSAAMALAPVARLAQGGSGAMGSALNVLQSLMGGSSFTSFTYGFAVAYNILQGVNFSATVQKYGSGSHLQSIVTINYPQQINVPGFASLWNFSLSQTPKGPYHNISSDLQALAKGSNSSYVPGQQDNFTYGGQWSGWSNPTEYVANGGWNFDWYSTYSYDQVSNGNIYQVNTNYDEHWIWTFTHSGGLIPGTNQYQVEEWTWQYTGCTISTTTNYVGQYVDPNAMPTVNILSQAATGCEEWSGVIKKADSNPPKYP